MKKLLLTLCMAGVAIAGYADLSGSGYYRVKNYGSDRWASLIDNTGSIDFVSGAADLHALSLNKDTEEVLSDPASIVYISNVKGNQYNVAAQGTSLANLVNDAVYIGKNGTATDGQTLYMIWGTKSNITKYIADGNIITSDQYGFATINDINYQNFKKWEILPVEVNGDNYFAAAPTVDAGGNLYTTLYTSFPYQPFSTGVKAYFIGRVAYGMAELIEINGAIPAQTPVIIQCAGENISNNRLEIKEAQQTISDNSLVGVYFDYKYNSIENQVVYDPQTMRILGRCADGSLGFITANIDYIPANTAYLKVSKGTPAELRCVPTSEFDAGVDTIDSDNNTLKIEGGIVKLSYPSEIKILSLDGKLVAKSFTDSYDLSILPKGAYIVNANGKSVKVVH